MAAIVYAPNALSNLERTFVYLAARDREAAVAAATAIREAVEVLAHHPFIGRAIDGEIRELVISFGKTGFAALYRFVEKNDEVHVLALRHQRELAYAASP